MTRFLTMILIVALTSNLAISQSTKIKLDRRFEIGAFLGVTNSVNDVVPNDFPDFGNSNFGYGIDASYLISPILSVGLNWRGGKISANDTDYSVRGNRNLAFDASINELSARLKWDILGNRAYKSGKFHKIVTPYLSAGVGAVFVNHSVTDYGNRATTAGALTDMAEVDNHLTSICTPLAIGIDFQLSESITLGLEGSTVPVFHDYLDGFSEVANPDLNDWYQHFGLTLGFKLGKVADLDEDGVSDKMDKCPNRAGLPEFEGCPDSDSDGIQDSEDKCPNVAGLESLGGCPDSDGDGVTNDMDECPNEYGDASLSGCPDADGDGIADKDDKCPTTAGSLNGCPDTDSDGVSDDMDECPNSPGALRGCPDADGDGIADKDDKCPMEAGILAENGCPKKPVVVDADGDGVVDNLDKCPGAAGPASNNGCPVIHKDDRAILESALRNVEFQSGSTKIKSSSYSTLDQVADILQRYPNYNVRVKGYTDNTGNAVSNQTLSEGRARACAKYLTNKGISATRVSSIGYGETSPIATNKTTAGRKMNRRVEFDLYLSR